MRFKIEGIHKDDIYARMIPSMNLNAQNTWAINYWHCYCCRCCFRIREKSGPKENKLIAVTSKTLSLSFILSSPVPLKYHTDGVSWNGVDTVPALEELAFLPECCKTKHNKQNKNSKALLSLLELIHTTLWVSSLKSHFIFLFMLSEVHVKSICRNHLYEYWISTKHSCLECKSHDAPIRARYYYKNEWMWCFIVLVK